MFSQYKYAFELINRFHQNAFLSSLAQFPNGLPWPYSPFSHDRTKQPRCPSQLAPNALHTKNEVTALHCPSPHPAQSPERPYECKRRSQSSYRILKCSIPLMRHLAMMAISMATISRATVTRVTRRP